jgi:2-iminobutanoate/2-iminopropanoate deaminase
MTWSDPDDSTAENRQAWQRFSEAWAKRDIDGLMALVTDDIIYGASVGPEPGATFRGRDEVRRGFEHMLRHDQVLREHAGPVLIVGDHGFAEWTYDVRLADGSDGCERGIDVLEFANGRLARKDAFRKVRGQGGRPMKRTVVHTDKVPPARVPLSQAIKIGDWVFASGQLGMDPQTGRLIEGGIKAETRQVCENLKAVLEAGGSSLARVAKVTIYMADLAELMAMNEVFREYFPKEPPARTTFQAAGLVAGARLEIEAIAFA